VGGRLEGLIAAPFTPMKENGEVNLAVIEKQAELLRRNGVVGVFVCGTTGEGMSLTLEERKRVAERWVEVAPEGFRVLVHIGHTSPEAVKELAAHSAKIGAAGVGAMGPCFFRPATVGDLVAFCEQTAAAAPDLPFYYYHIPSMTGVDFRMAEFLEAAAPRIPNLGGIKFTSGDLMDFGLCLELADGKYDILFGMDEYLLCGLVIGGRGAIGSTYNFAAPLYTRLIESFARGDLEEARALQVRSMKMVRLLEGTGVHFLGAAKAVMKMVGVDCGPVRPPLGNLTAEQYRALQAELEKLGFFDYCSK